MPIYINLTGSAVVGMANSWLHHRLGCGDSALARPNQLTLADAGLLYDALALFRRAVEKNISDELLFRTLWDIADIERKLERLDASLAVLTDLAASRNPFRAAALEALAKHYEHRLKNYAMALEMTSAALAISDTEALRRRRERLERKLSGQKARPRLIT